MLSLKPRLHTVDSSCTCVTLALSDLKPGNGTLPGGRQLHPPSPGQPGLPSAQRVDFWACEGSPSSIKRPSNTWPRYMAKACCHRAGVMKRWPGPSVNVRGSLPTWSTTSPYARFSTQKTFSNIASTTNLTAEQCVIWTVVRLLPDARTLTLNLLMS
jgi:hypothetical protein